MRRTLHGPFIWVFVFSLFFVFSSCSPPVEEGSSTIRHVVLFKFKQDASKQEIEDAFNALLALKGKIPGITSIKTGSFGSHEGLHKEFTHGFTMDFIDEDASERYHSHPERQVIKSKFLNLLDGGIEGVIAGELGS